ncbi:MAG: hypothetical protein ACFFAD_16500 [Candidatus Hermodarchaeota archaeon]
MSILISILQETQKECEEFSEWLSELSPSLEKSFNILHNHAMSAEELLEGIGTLEVKTEKQAHERIMLILRSNWIFMLSVIEYSIKQILEQSAKPLGIWYNNLQDDSKVKGKKRGFSLRSVMNESQKRGMIELDQRDSWIGLQDMRNAIIHNNAYMEEDKTFKVGDFERSFIKGEKIHCTHIDRAGFIQIIPRLWKDWLKGHLLGHVQSPI